jgi:predicted transcriptional regulator
MAMRDTSREAYEGIKPELKIKRKRVFEAIKAQGPQGATLFELVKIIGRPVNEISGRVTELSKNFMIEESGKRQNPDTLKNAIVWVAKQNE